MTTAAATSTSIQRQSSYVLGVVLFAVALFLAGMSTKLASRGRRRVLLACGYVVFLGTVAWIATFPINGAVILSRTGLRPWRPSKCA